MYKKNFTEVLSKFSTGVTVITLGNKKKGFYGCTVNSFTSVSLNPPKILFCIDNNNSFINQLKANTFLNISILSSKQKNLSNKFASMPEKRWIDTKFQVSKKDIPFFDQSLVTMECRIDKKINSGDHKIIICDLNKILKKLEGNPLIYFNSKYIK